MGYASDTFANLTRQQYADWQQRFQPQQEKLMSLATDNSLLNAQLDRTAGNAANAVSSAQDSYHAQMSRMGISTPLNTNDNSNNLNTSLAVAAAKNGTRTAAEERQLSILAGNGARAYATSLTGDQ
jgi:hypothetical protein